MSSSRSIDNLYNPISRQSGTNEYSKYLSQKNDSTYTATVRTVYPFTGSVALHVDRIGWIQALDASNNYSSNGSGIYVPLKPGDRVLVIFPEGSSGKAIITQRLPQATGADKLIEAGQVGNPQAVNDQNKFITYNPTAYVMDGVAEFGNIVYGGQELIKQIDLKVSPSYSGLPGSHYTIDAGGNITFNALGTFNVNASSYYFDVTSPAIDYKDYQILEEVFRYERIKSFVDANFPITGIDTSEVNFSITNATFNFSDVAVSKKTEEKQEAFIKVLVDRVRKAEKQFEDQEQIEKLCTSLITDILKGNWSGLYKAVLDFLEGQIIGFAPSLLNKINQQLPEWAQVSISESGVVSVGAISWDPATNKINYEQALYSLAGKGINSINKHLPSWAQINFDSEAKSITVAGKTIKLSDIEELDLDNLEGSINLKDIDIDFPDVKLNGNLTVTVGKETYDLLDAGVDLLNSQLKDKADVSVRRCSAVNKQRTFAKQEPIECSPNDIVEVQVGPVIFNNKTGDLRLDQEQTQDLFNQALGSLPPTYQLIARILFKKLDFGKAFAKIFGFELKTKEEDESLAVKEVCELFASKMPQSLPALFTSKTVKIDKNPKPESDRVITQPFVAAVPYKYVEPENNLDFVERPEEGVAALITSYGIPKAGALVNSLNDYFKDSNALAALDIVSLVGVSGAKNEAPGLTAAMIALSIALERPVEQQLDKLATSAPETCSGVAPLKELFKGITIEEAVDYIRRDLGYPEFDITSFLNNPQYLFDWASKAEPEYAEAFSNLKDGKVLEFLEKLVLLRTSHDLSDHQAKDQLSYYTNATYGSYPLGDIFIWYYQTI